MATIRKALWDGVCIECRKPFSKGYTIISEDGTADACDVRHFDCAKVEQKDDYGDAYRRPQPPARRDKPAWERMLIMAEDYSPAMAVSVIRELKRRGMQVPEAVRAVLERKAGDAGKAAP